MHCGYLFAEDSNSNVYFDLGAGASTINNLPTGAATVNMNWGYNFNRGLALEAGWAGMPSEQWGKLDNYNIYDIAVKGTIPLTKTFDLYGRLGVGAAYSSWSGSCGDPAYYSPGSAWSMVGVAGIGAAFNLSPKFSLYLENNNYIPTAETKGSFGSASSVMFGFQYNFVSSSTTAQNNDSQINTGITSTSSTNSGIEQATVAPVVIADVQKEESSTQMTSTGAGIPASIDNSSFDSRVQTDSDGNRYIVLTSGDSLYSISCYAGVNISKLKSLNNIRGNDIRAGKKLYLGTISDKPTKIDLDSFKKRVINKNGQTSVEVICGDTLYHISLYSGVSEDKLVKLNKLNDKHTIFVGQVLKLD